MIGRGRKRFWTTASARPSAGGWEVRLDDRLLRTPAKAVLLVPSRMLAEAIAAEWQAQDSDIRPQSMPLTRAANAAIDKVARSRGEVVDMLAAYGETDLLCYRAGEPAALRALQDRDWQPWLDWARRDLGVRLEVRTGLIHVPQGAGDLARLRAELMRLDDLELTAAHDLIAISGSLILGLAVVAGALPAAEAFALSRLDEHWQRDQWGRDEQAEAAEHAKCREFLDAADFLRLARNRSAPA